MPFRRNRWFCEGFGCVGMMKMKQQELTNVPCIFRPTWDCRHKGFHQVMNKEGEILYDHKLDVCIICQLMQVQTDLWKVRKAISGD